MKKYNLKLTCITQELKKKENNYYLGAWCFADNTDEIADDVLIQEYHWNNRKKLKEDYYGLNNFISNNFQIFSDYMSNLTDTTNDKRYWKINLGTWIGYLIQILFDRWENIKNLPEYDFYLSEDNDNHFPLRSNTVRDFFKDFFTDDWNEQIYRLILKVQKKNINYIKFNKKKISYTDYKKNSLENIKLKNSLRTEIFKKITELYHLFYQPRHFMVNSYLSRIDEIKLKLYLGEFPFNYKREIYDPNIDYSKISNKNGKIKKLETVNLKINKYSSWEYHNREFLNWFSTVLPELIPYNYSHNFKKFFHKMKKLPFPKNPKIIFTSVLHVQHDYFNLYTSENVMKGSKYYIGQHGGGFRSSEICFKEDLHKDLSNYYLTWGDNKIVGENKFPSKVISVGNLKTSSKSAAKNNFINNRVLLLTIEYPRYSYALCSEVISSQWLKYYNDLKLFIDKLTDFGISKNIVIRNKLRNYAWKLDKKIKFQYPNIKFDEINDYFKSVKSSDLIISTYNGATYLETMSLNIPTIFFWDPIFWELNQESIKDYDELKKVNIFHHNSKSAAEFYNKIQPNINEWWFSEKVQIARENFCNKYSKINKKISQDISNIMKQCK